MSDKSELTPVRPGVAARKRQKRALGDAPVFAPTETQDPNEAIAAETSAVTESNRIRGYNVAMGTAIQITSSPINVAIGMGQAANAGFIEGVQQGMAEVQASQASLFSGVIGQISQALQ